MASHLWCAHKGGFTTVPERLIHWGNSTGMVTGALVTRLLEAHKHPEHGYRACLGLLALAKRFTRLRLEAACAVALELGTTNGWHVRDILINGCNRVCPSTMTNGFPDRVRSYAFAIATGRLANR